MKGYKALNNDMTTLYGHMTYDLNKVYRKYSKLELCKNGFHFCSNLIEVFEYYKVSDCRVFEIDTLDGKVIECEYEDKYCTDTIKLIREISQEEISKYIEKNLDTLIEYYTSV